MEYLPVVGFPGYVAARQRQSELILLFIVEIHITTRRGQLFAVGGEGEKAWIVFLDGLFVACAEARHTARPADRPAVLIVELHSETAGIVALAVVHERWDIGVIKEAFVVSRGLADQFL